MGCDIHLYTEKKNYDGRWVRSLLLSHTNLLTVFRERFVVETNSEKEDV